MAGLLTAPVTVTDPMARTVTEEGLTTEQLLAGSIMERGEERSG
jgi:hypothetical protein